VVSIVGSLESESDPVVRKLVLSLLGKMIYCWAESSYAVVDEAKGLVGAPKGNKKELLKRTPLNGFNSFIYERILPTILRVPFNIDINPSDGQYLLVMTELANIHKTTYTILGDEYCKFLVDTYFPSQSVPAQAAFEFANAIAQQDKRAFRKTIIVYIVN
jgi:exportin-T